MNLQKDSERGYQANELLNNELFSESINMLRQGIVDKWRETPIRDKEGQHELKLMDKVLTDMVNYLKTIISNGKMADIQLEQEKKLSKLHKAGIR